MIITYDIPDLLPYINWAYFFFAWNMHNKSGEEQARLRDEAEAALKQVADRYHAYAMFSLYDANSDGDDIVIKRSERGEVRGERLPLLRQQQPGSDCLCLSDFISPSNMSLTSHLSLLTSICTECLGPCPYLCRLGLFLEHQRHLCSYFRVCRFVSCLLECPLSATTPRWSAVAAG